MKHKFSYNFIIWCGILLNPKSFLEVKGLPKFKNSKSTRLGSRENLHKIFEKFINLNDFST